MKKLLFFGMMGALALTFGACSSEDDLANVNPTYDGNAVKTQFAINVGTGNFVTRSTAADVQVSTDGNAPTFLGMDNMTLFAFTGTPAAASETTTKFALGSIGKTITFDDTNKFYTLQIPVGTNNFVFYGEAPVATDAAGYAAKGVLTNNVASAATLGAIEFALKTRYASAFATNAATIAAKLTTIAQASATVGEATKTWAASEDATLKAMYTNFTNTTGKIRAGYDFAVNRMLKDLKDAATQLKTSGLTDEVKAIAAAIEAAIGDYTVSDFPGADMPAGAAQLEWTGSAFQYKTAANTFGPEYAATTVDPQKIAYPASLVYWDNSDLRATDQEKTEADYPNGIGAATGKWFPDASWTSDWAVGPVKATTRAIAMKRNINYGVAGLHSTVAWTAGTYKDNRGKLVAGLTPAAGETDTEEDEAFTVDDNSFTLTGILVGGQSEKADWQMLPKSDFNWVVYDNTVDATNKESYTLLLDNYAETAKDVLVALEFTNNLTHKVTKMVVPEGGGDPVAQLVDEPADFFGVDGIIPAGGKFYLVGKLEIPTGAAWEEAYENDRIEDAIRIFAQDRMTEANFKFSVSALKNAYETIPDLQSVAMLFGLSVDIKWLKGLTFNDVQL